MRTRVLRSDDEGDVWEAARVLRAGRIVAFPTETVYGLGARADDEDAMARLYQVKRRPADKKMAILIPDLDHVARYAAELPPRARLLAEAFWPGPLTLVVPDGRGGEVGLRCPACEPTRAMLRAAQVPVAAPSANVSGQEPARSAAQVLESFEGQIDAVLDGGKVELGRSSTVVRVGEGEVQILREGALAEEHIRRALQTQTGQEGDPDETQAFEEGRNRG